MAATKTEAGQRHKPWPKQWTCSCDCSGCESARDSGYGHCRNQSTGCNYDHYIEEEISSVAAKKNNPAPSAGFTVSAERHVNRTGSITFSHFIVGESVIGAIEGFACQLELECSLTKIPVFTHDESVKWDFYLVSGRDSSLKIVQASNAINARCFFEERGLDVENVARIRISPTLL